jgi:hypothetical protein
MHQHKHAPLAQVSFWPARLDFVRRPAAFVDTGLNGDRFTEEAIERRRQFGPPRLVETQRQPVEMGSSVVEPAPAPGVCGLREDPAKGLANEAPPQRDGQLLPCVLVDVGALNRAIEVLHRAAARLRPRQLDEPEVPEHAHVPADGPERLPQLTGDRERTRLASLDDRFQNPEAKRMPERLVKGGLEKVVGAHQSEH